MLTLGGLAGAAGGWAFSDYCGACAWIPGGLAIILLVIFTKTPLRPKWFVGAIAVTGAHTVWFIIGSALSGMWGADIIILLIGIIWLWLRPGIAAVIYLGIVQLVSLAITAPKFASTHYGDAMNRALTAHTVFRVIAIVCLISGYIRMRRAQVTPDSSTTILSDEVIPPNA